MLEKAGPPHDISYLLLGDYVDRGIFGVAGSSSFFAIVDVRLFAAIEIESQKLMDNAKVGSYLSVKMGLTSNPLRVHYQGKLSVSDHFF